MIEKITVLLIILSLVACNAKLDNTKDAPLAKVYDNHLYYEDIAYLFGAEISAQDSLIIIKNYIEKWVKKQLILQKAEFNLTPQQKDVTKQLEEYRSSLIIYKYEEEYIKQKLDTNVTQQEVDKYYTDYLSNFKLTTNIVKASFIKMPNASPYVDDVKRLYRSTEEEDLKQLDSYCFQTATKYDFFDDNWINFNEIMKNVPYEVKNPERFLRSRKYIEVQDSLFSYFVNFREFENKGSDSPIDYVSGRIRNIIINKRKIELLNALETRIYRDALNKNQLIVY